jgi:thiamine biosynthesis protein ThiI
VRILARFSGDISTKARNTRKQFVKQLATNLKDALKAGGHGGRVERTWSRLTIETDDPTAVETCSRVFGVQSLSPVERHPWESKEDILELGHETFREQVEGRSFAVRSKRSGQNVGAIPFGSLDIERELGALLLPYARKVDLSNPEVTAALEVRRKHVDLFTARIPGSGGLPVRVSGRALSLVSGGFDSAVASWQMLKRGVALDYLFFNLGGLAHEVGVLRVMKIIADRWSYGDRPRLFAVDMRPAVEAMQKTVTPRYWQVVLKRLMMIAASQVAEAHGHASLVTGEAVGQVSSQTLQNLAVITDASRSMILRPLVGFNKEEIVAVAREIGTFEVSAAVGEYCALLPKNPATRARHEAIMEEESTLDLSLLSEAVETRRTIDLRALDADKIGARQLETDHIPEGATIVDLRPKATYDSWHFPEALHLEYSQALSSYASFRRDVPYVLYCEIGLKSAHLAEQMQNEGFEAHHMRGGVRQLKALATART